MVVPARQGVALARRSRRRAITRRRAPMPRAGAPAASTRTRARSSRKPRRRGGRTSVQERHDRKVGGPEGGERPEGGEFRGGDRDSRPAFEGDRSNDRSLARKAARPRQRAATVLARRGSHSASRHSPASPPSAGKPSFRAKPAWRKTLPSGPKPCGPTHGARPPLGRSRRSGQEPPFGGQTAVSRRKPRPPFSGERPQGDRDDRPRPEWRDRGDETRTGGRRVQDRARHEAYRFGESAAATRKTGSRAVKAARHRGDRARSPAASRRGLADQLARNRVAGAFQPARSSRGSWWRPSSTFRGPSSTARAMAMAAQLRSASRADRY